MTVKKTKITIERRISLNLFRAGILIFLLIIIYYINLYLYPLFKGGDKENMATSRPIISLSPTTTTVSKPPYEPVCETKESYEIKNDADQWLTLSSSLLGLSFETLIPEGEIDFIYKDCKERKVDPTGKLYRWYINTHTTRQNIFREGGAVSKDFGAGREMAITDFYQLEKSHYTKAIKIYKTKYNTDAILFRSDYRFGGSDLLYPGLTLAVNLPFKAGIPFRGLILYFPNGISETDAQRVVSSITLK